MIIQYQMIELKIIYLQIHSKVSNRVSPKLAKPFVHYLPIYVAPGM